MHDKRENNLADFELFSDEEENKNELKYQLRRKLREIKRKANNRNKKEKDVTDGPSASQSHVIIELEKLNTGKKNKISNSTLKIENEDLKNYIEKNLFISPNREFSEAEKELIESWRLYSKKEMKLKKKGDDEYCMKKSIFYFFSLFFITFIIVFGAYFIVKNMFDTLNSIKRSD